MRRNGLAHHHAQAHAPPPAPSAPRLLLAVLQLKDDNARAEEDLAEKQAAMKKAKEDHVEWESTRDKRVNTWHDFVKGKGGKLTTAGGCRLQGV